MIDTSPTASGSFPENPFVGPRSLGWGETLFGRDREIRELRDVLIADRIVLLHSPSGAGKSSLLEAGMRPELESQGFDVRPTIRVGYEIPESPGSTFNRYVLSTIVSLGAHAHDESEMAIGELARSSLPEYIAQVREVSPEGSDLCLFFDQFEEIFTLDPLDQGEKREFFTQLGSVLRDPGVWALIAMREDYIAELEPYLKFMPRRLATRYRLDFLDRSAAAAAISGPVTRAGREFSRSAINSLVEDLSRVRIVRNGEARFERGNYVEPVQLQVVCRQLWQKLGDHQGIVKLEDIRGLVNSDGALAEFYAQQVEAVARQVDVSERRIRQWIENSLITPQGFRAQAFEFPGSGGPAVLRGLEDAYVIRSDRRRGVTWYELTHDRLVSPIMTDNSEWTKSHLLPVQQRATEWDRQGRSSGLLISGEVLEEAEVWADSPDADVSDVERSFIRSSRENVEQRRLDDRRSRRRTTAYLVLAVLALVGMFASIVFFASSRRSLNNAESARAEAEARDFASRSASTRDPYAALLLAMEAQYRTENPLPFARTAWLEASERLGSNRLRLISPRIRLAMSTPYWSSWSPDGRHFAALDEGGDLSVFDDSGEKVSTHSLGETSRNPSWSFDGKFIAVSSDEEVSILDPIRPSKKFRTIEGQWLPNSDNGWSPTANVLIAHDANGVLILYDVEKGTVKLLSPKYCDGIDWSPDGDRFVSTCYSSNSSGARVVIFDRDGGILQEVTFDDESFTYIEWNDSGTSVALLNSYNQVFILDANGKLLKKAFDRPEGSYSFGAHPIQWSPNGSHLLITTDRVRVLDSASGEFTEISTAGQASGYEGEFLWNPARPILATSSGVGKVGLLSALGESLVPEISTGNSWVRSMVWNEDGSRLAVLNWDGSISLIDESGNLIQRTFSVGLLPSQIEWHPDGKRLSVLGTDGTLRLVTEADASESEVNSMNLEFGGIVAWNPSAPILAATVDGSGLLLTNNGQIVDHDFWSDPRKPRNDCQEEIDPNCDWTFDVHTLGWNQAGTLLVVGASNSGLDGFENNVFHVLDSEGNLKFSIRSGPQGYELQSVQFSFSPVDDRVSAVVDGSLVVYQSDGSSVSVKLPDYDPEADFPIQISSAWNPSGTSIVVLVGNRLYRWDTRSESVEFLSSISPFLSSQDQVTYSLLGFDASNTMAVSVVKYPSISGEKAESTLMLIDASGRTVGRIDTSGDEALPRVNSGGKILLVDESGKMRIAAFDGGYLTRSFIPDQCREERVEYFEWSPNGELLVSKCGGTLSVYSAEGKLLNVYTDQSGEPNPLGLYFFQFGGSWSPDSSTFVFSQSDVRLRFMGPEVGPFLAFSGNRTVYWWGSTGNMALAGGEKFEILYGWSEVEACELLRRVMSREEMYEVLDLEDYSSRCADGEVVEALPIIPVSPRPLVFP